MNRSPVVLITGSSRGIGAATALYFAKHGYDVCINYKADLASAILVAEKVKQLGVEAEVIQGDVSLEADVLALFMHIDKVFGQLDVLINNAGILKPQMPLLGMSAERINEVLTTNITSAFLCSREAIKRMGNSGSIVNVSSGAAKTGSPNEYIDYAASKGAMDTFTIGLAKEVASKGIRVNSVRPGLIYTDMHSDGGKENRVDRLKSKLPLDLNDLGANIITVYFYYAK